MVNFSIITNLFPCISIFLFPWGFQTRILYFLFLSMCATFFIPLSLLDLMTPNNYKFLKLFEISSQHTLKHRTVRIQEEVVQDSSDDEVSQHA
jgi:amino acid permease